MNKVIALLIGVLFQCSAYAQYSESIRSEQQEVLDVVVKLFDGMREGDSAKVHSVFRQNPEMHTSYSNKEGKAIFLNDDIQKFLNAVGTPHDQIWDEKIWGNEVRIDGNLATVWSNYAFYLGDQFSHCGVDAFILNREENEWKIFHLTDTRKRIGCELPESIKK